MNNILYDILFLGYETPEASGIIDANAIHPSNAVVAGLWIFKSL